MFLEEVRHTTDNIGPVEACVAVSAERYVVWIRAHHQVRISRPASSQSNILDLPYPQQVVRDQDNAAAERTDIRQLQRCRSRCHRLATENSESTRLLWPHSVRVAHPCHPSLRCHRCQSSRGRDLTGYTKLQPSQKSSWIARNATTFGTCNRHGTMVCACHVLV